MKFSKATVTALAMPPGKTDHIEWDPDLPAFGVRLRTRSKSWVAQYRVGKQQRRESLGDVRKVSLDDARKIARQRFAQVELGQDPTEARPGAGLLLRHMIDRYLDAKRGQLRPSSFRQGEHCLRNLWQPLHGRELATIKRVDVGAVLLDLSRSRGRLAASNARSYLSALFSWAMREGLAEVNPVIGSNDPRTGIAPRDRVLDDRELALVWRACANIRWHIAAPITRLLILLGCRGGEIRGLKWSDVDLEAGTLHIPKERIKNNRPLRLLLPGAALAILRAVPRREGDFVFGRKAGFSDPGILKIQLDASISALAGAPIEPWTVHDLRRTMRTGLSRIGIAPHVAEAAINHARGALMETYDRHSFDREVGVALERWADHVLAIVEGRPAANVVPLRA